MFVIEGLINRIKQIRGYYGERYDEGEYYEFCTNCDANLTLQKGYSPSLKYWYCRGCGQLQINPDMESDIVWYCDRCEAVLTDQEGFTEEEAADWIDYNTLRALPYMGADGPIILHRFLGG